MYDMQLKDLPRNNCYVVSLIRARRLFSPWNNMILNGAKSWVDPFTWVEIGAESLSPGSHRVLTDIPTYLYILRSVES